MDYRLTRLDKRHKGHLSYKFSLHPIWKSKYTYATAEYDQMFVDARIWCWETWGPSTELMFSSRNEHWAWDSEFNNRRIYLKCDQELAFFLLKFNT